MYPVFEEYKKLNAFLSENNLEILSCFNATDLGCAYRIQRKGVLTRYGYPVICGEKFLSFMCKPWDHIDFSWDIQKNSESISEEEFINHIKTVFKDFLFKEDDLKDVAPRQLEIPFET